MNPLIPNDYPQWLMSLKTRIRQARVQASLSVNRELIHLYWSIGNTINQQRATQSWGAKVIAQLAHDLRTEFPDMKGLSSTNLKYMARFAKVWSEAAIGQQAVDQLRQRQHQGRMHLAHRCRTEKIAGNTSGSTPTGP